MAEIKSPFIHHPDGTVELDQEMFRQLFAQGEKDRKYIEHHYQEWLEKYPDMTVVVYKEELVAVGNSVEEIDRQLEKKNVPGNITTRRTLHTKPVRTVRVPIWP